MNILLRILHASLDLRLWPLNARLAPPFLDHKYGLALPLSLAKDRVGALFYGLQVVRRLHICHLINSLSFIINQSSRSMHLL